MLWKLNFRQNEFTGRKEIYKGSEIYVNIYVQFDSSSNFEHIAWN
jgi:hypothetical protein